jgi:hypothetical protein
LLFLFHFVDPSAASFCIFCPFFWFNGGTGEQAGRHSGECVYQTIPHPFSRLSKAIATNKSSRPGSSKSGLDFDNYSLISNYLCCVEMMQGEHDGSEPGDKRSE